MNISVKNLYVDAGAIRVKVQIGVTNINVTSKKKCNPIGTTHCRPFLDLYCP